MEQLIDQIVQKTGISHDQASQAAQTVVAFLKDKLPGPIASQLDGVLSGQSAGSATDQAQQALGGMGGALGGILGGSNPDQPGN